MSDDLPRPHGRMVAYAGTAVGLVKGVKPAANIVDEILSDARTAARSALRAWDGDEATEKL